MAGLPGQAGEPVVDVLPGHGGAGGVRVVAGFGAFQGLAEGPGYLAQLEGAAVATTAVVGAGEAAALQPHGGQVRRVEAGQGRLGVGGVGEAKGGDLAVAPGLFSQPLDGVVAVPAFVHVLGEAAFGIVTATAVLDDGDVAVVGEEGGFFEAGSGRLVVGGALEQHRQRLGYGFAVGQGPVYVGGQVDSVAGGHHEVFDNVIIAFAPGDASSYPGHHLPPFPENVKK